VVEPRDITVLDRIGGGDGFVGGLLYAILKDGAGEVDPFGWATGALATTMLTDYAQPADETSLEHLERQRPRAALKFQPHFSSRRKLRAQPQRELRQYAFGWRLVKPILRRDVSSCAHLQRCPAYRSPVTKLLVKLPLNVSPNFTFVRLMSAKFGPIAEPHIPRGNSCPFQTPMPVLLASWVIRVFETLAHIDLSECRLRALVG